MIDIALPVVLQLVGVTVIIAEFVVPSGGILGITAAASLGYSLYHVFRYISPTVGFVFVGADVILVPASIVVGIKILAHSPVTLRQSLSSVAGATSQDLVLKQLVGQAGVALTDLRPSGKALVEGKRFDVVSRGDYIAKGSGISVSAVDGNRIVVVEYVETGSKTGPETNTET